MKVCVGFASMRPKCFIGLSRAKPAADCVILWCGRAFCCRVTCPPRCRWGEKSILKAEGKTQTWLPFDLLPSFWIQFYLKPSPSDVCTLKYLTFNFIFFIFWPCHTACRILVPRPGIEPTPPAVEAQSLKHRTAREILWLLTLNKKYKQQTREDSVTLLPINS